MIAIRSSGARPMAIVVRALVSLGGVLLLAGCLALGPDYEAPEAPLEEDWLDAGNPLIAGSATTDPRWWRTAYQDPVLHELVDLALAQNLSLRSAGLRVLQSRQQLAIAIGNQFPQQQQATGSASKQREQSTTFEEYNLGLNVSWELDFWGRFRRQVESASAALEANVAAYDGALVSIAAQAAQTYILIRTFQERIAVAEFNVRLQRQSLRIAEAKFNGGEVSQLDVNQAESLLYNTVAQVAGLQASLQQTKNSLAVLLGQPPQDLAYLLGQGGAIPVAPPSVALGMPQDLIRQRPDIRVAERQLAAQSAQIGVAITDLYPAFSIGGAIGTEALDTGDLFDGDSETWNLFGAFRWNLFNYGRLRSNVRLQDARFQELLTDYLDTVLQAQADVESNIVAYLRSQDQLGAYGLAATASQEAVDIATIQYREGEIDFNTLINTLSANVQQQDLLAATRGGVAGNLVQVYRALGGGWEIRADRDPVELLPEAVREQMRERTRAWGSALQ